MAFTAYVTGIKYDSFVRGLYSGANLEPALVGEPRMYVVRVRYHFGS